MCNLLLDIPLGELSLTHVSRSRLMIVRYHDGTVDGDEEVEQGTSSELADINDVGEERRQSSKGFHIPKAVHT